MSHHFFIFFYFERKKCLIIFNAMSNPDLVIVRRIKLANLITQLFSFVCSISKSFYLFKLVKTIGDFIIIYYFIFWAEYSSHSI